MDINLTKDKATINECVKALEDRDCILALAGTIDIGPGRLLKRLCKSYTYWANQDSDAFRKVGNIGYGFPFTNKMLQEMADSGILSDARVYRTILEDYGLLNVSLEKTSNDRTVSYYVLQPDKIVSFILGCVNLFQNYSKELEEVKQELADAKARVVSAEIAEKNYIRDSIVAYMMTAENAKEPNTIDEP